MKKFIMFIMFVLVLLPSLVFAQNVEIKEVKLVEKSENAEIINHPKIDALSVDFNIKLNAVGDYVKYKVIINNKDNVNYTINEYDFKENEYIKYEIECDNLKELEANKESILYLKIKYDKEIPKESFENNKYVLNNEFSLTLDNGLEETTTTSAENVKNEEIKNPETGLKDYGLIIGITILILSLIIYAFYKRKKYFKTLVLIISFCLLLMPITGIAVVVMKFSMNTTVTVEKGVALYEVSIDPNGGIYDDKTDKTVVRLIDGKTYDVSKPKREGYIFSRWEIEGRSTSIYDEKNSSIKIVSSDIVLKAIWVEENNIIAKIKETGIVYESIQAAFNAAKNNETVILINDSEENTKNEKKITFDLNGHTQNGSLENKGNILLYGGSIESEDIAIKNEGTLTLGFDDEKVNSYECKVGEDKGCVSIIGKNQGIDTQNGTFNFYDGYIKGTIGVLGGCNKTPYYGADDDGSKIYYHATVDNDSKLNYQYVYLTDSSKAVSKTITNGEVYYYNLQDNFNNSMITGYEVYAVRDFEAAYLLNVDEDKNIIFDISGYEVKTGNDITNNGTLEIINSNDTRGKIEASHSIINNGLLKLNKVKIEGNSNAAIVINNKDLEMVSSTIKGSTGYGVSANESTGTIKMDDTSLISSTSNAGLNISKDVTQTITNGNISSDKSNAIYNQNGVLVLDGVKVSSTSNAALNNYGTTTINSGDFISDTSYAVYNNGKLYINGGNIKSNKSYALYNYQEMEVNGGTISSDKSNALYNVYSATINNGTFISDSNSVVYNTNVWGRVGNLKINGGNFKTSSSTNTNAAIYNSATLTITGGLVESAGSYGIQNASTLTIGENDDEIDDKNPIIVGSTYGLYITNGTVKFYDGVLKGKTKGYYGDFSEVSDGTNIVEDIEEIEKQEFIIDYLTKQSDFLEVNGVKYNSFEKALKDIDSSGTIKVIADANINYAMTIPKGKNITLDLNGKKINTTVTFLNLGTFKICDTTGTKTGTIVNNKNILVQNNNTSSYTTLLNIDGVNLNSTLYTIVSNVCGTINISNSNIVSDKGTGISNSSGDINFDSSTITVGNGTAIYNYSRLNINSGKMESNSSYAVYNTGTIIMNDGEIKSSGYAVQNYERFTINGGNLLSTGNLVVSNTSTWGHVGYLFVNGGTIKSTGTSKSSYGIQNQTYLTITGGAIESASSYGVYQSSGTLTIGTLDEDVNINSPVLMGSTYGLYMANGTINFYDGILKGKTNGYYGEFSSVVDGYVIKNEEETINNENYKVNYLVKQNDFLEVNGVKYNSFEKALSSIEETGTIKVISDANINFAMTIPVEKNITLDLNSHTLTTSAVFLNKGTFTITDTVGGGSIVNPKSYLVQNSDSTNITGTLNISNVTLKSSLSTCVNNYKGNISIDNSKILSDNSVALYSGDGNATITISNSTLNTERYEALSTYSNTIIDNCTIYTKSSYAISNRGNITFNSGKISSDSSYAIYNYGRFTINGGEIESKATSAIYNTSTYGYVGNMTINDGRIKSTGTNNNSYGIHNTVTLTILGGEIESTNSYGIYNTSTINIGTSDDTVSIINPVVKGDTYGLYVASGTINFYDGILKGKTNGYYGNISTIQENYEIASNEELIGEDNYKTNYLIKKSEYIQNERLNKNYLSLKLAIEEASSGDTLKIVSNGNSYDEITIPDGKSLTINFNGYSVNTSKIIKNQGTLTLINSSSDKIALSTNANAYLIQNNGILNLNNVYLKVNSSYQTVDNYKTLNIVSSKLDGGYGIYNENGGTMTINDSIVIGKQYAIYNRNKFEIYDSVISGTSYGIYSEESANKQVNIIKDSNIEMTSVTTSNGIYNSKGTINMTNVDMNSGLTSNGTLTYDTGNLGYSIINSGTMDLNNLIVNCDGYAAYYNYKSIISNTKNMTLKNSKLTIINPNSNELRGIYNAGLGTLDLVNVDLVLDKNDKTGNLYGIYQENGSINYTNSNIDVNIGSNVYGIYVKNGNIDILSGSINANNKTNSYGIYIENGTVTLGEVEDSSSEVYGTENANVSITNPSIKAVGTTTGIGVKRVNGYFNFYDGIITGSTNAKPDVTSTVEYKYQVENYRDSDNYEYCILEYMKE